MAERGKIMGDQYVIVKMHVVRKSPFEMLTLPSVLKVGVTKHRYLQMKTASRKRNGSIYSTRPLYQHRENPYMQSLFGEFS